MSLLRPALIGSIVLLVIVPRVSAQQNTDGDSWTVSGNISGLYDSNALFVDGADPASDLAIRAQTGVQRLWTLQRGSVGLSASLTRPFYQKTAALSTLMYDFGGAFSYELTPRLKWSLLSNVAQSLAQDSKVITDTGVVLPSAIARTGSTTTAFAYELSPRTQMTVNVAQVGVGFKSTVFRPGIPLKGGSILSTGVGVSRSLSPSQTLGFTQSYAITFGNEENSHLQSYLATWTVLFGKIWTLTASGGIRPYTVPGQKGYRITPGGGAALTMKVREGHDFGVHYERGIEQAFGLDRTHLTQTVGARYSMGLGRRVKTDFDFSHTRGTYPLIPDLLLLGDLATASVSCDITHGLALSVTSSLYSRQFTPDPTVSSYRTSMALVYGKSWQ